MTQKTTEKTTPKMAPELGPKLTPDAAVMAYAGAQRKRALAEEMETLDPVGASWERREADEMDARAHAALVPEGELAQGPSGEILPIDENAQRHPRIVDVVRQSPGLLAADASIERLRLTGDALTLAIEASTELKASDPAEKMLAHGMAVAHRQALRLIERSNGMLDRTDSARHHDWREQAQVAARLSGAGARMMAAVAGAAIALQRFRAGGQHTIQVVHQQVAVADGGQAIVAGQVGVGAGVGTQFRKAPREPREGVS